MKIRAAFAFFLAAVVATTAVSAQTKDSNSAALRPRLDMTVTLSSADRADVIADQPALPRLAVAPVTRQRSRKNSVWPTVAGAAIGGVIGVYTGMGVLLSDAQCQPNCGPRIAAGASLLIGGPIVGGLIGYWIGKR